MHVWITGLAGLRGRAWWNNDCASLCKPEGAAQRRSCVCGLLAWLALGARSGGDHVGLKDGHLGEQGPGRAEEQAQGLEIVTIPITLVLYTIYIFPHCLSPLAPSPHHLMQL
jgi:hypothetical protein